MNTKVTDISGPDALLREYDLVGERKQEPHYYEIQTELATHSSKGFVKSVDTYREFRRRSIDFIKARNQRIEQASDARC